MAGGPFKFVTSIHLHAVSCCEMYCIGDSLFDNLVCSLFVHVGVLCCFALFVCLTLLASFFLPSHLSLKTCTVQYCSHYSLVYTYSVLNYSLIRPWCAERLVEVSQCLLAFRLFSRHISKAIVSAKSPHYFSC